jgi:NAD(P)-dependent dehydrogenase (short-subunit alcohol dehydrogenase family)
MAPPTPNPVTNMAAWKDFVPNHNDTYAAISTASGKALLPKGLAVLITGASKGVGRATASSFASAGAAKIALAARSDLSEVKEEVLSAAKKAGHAIPEVVVLKVDVTDEKSVGKAAEEVYAKFDGKLDVLVNNAGYLEPWERIADSKVDEWWHSWEVNMKGPYLCTRAFLPLILAAPATTRLVINISSVGAHNIGYGASAYQGARFALCRFNEFVEREYSPDGVLSIAMHPGGVKTELALGMPSYMHGLLNDEPELAADFMVWLARERRTWLGGRLVSATWDVEKLEGRREEIVKGDLFKFRIMV